MARLHSAGLVAVPRRGRIAEAGQDIGATRARKRQTLACDRQRAAQAYSIFTVCASRENWIMGCGFCRDITWGTGSHSFRRRQTAAARYAKPEIKFTTNLLSARGTYGQTFLCAIPRVAGRR